MSKTGISLRKMCVLAGLTVLSVCAHAFGFDDARIVIDRALNSPELTVRYSGATVALVELKVNGESLGTRTVSAGKSSGQTNFTLNLAALKDGENTVEVCLYDKSGKLVGAEKTVITTGSGVQGPVFLTAPKVGAQVSGPVAIDVGFGRQMRNTYVSFFIDNQFKSLSNTPPFNYLWDTTRETNGWHTVEAWVVDDTNTTFKTQKTKVLVNNPGGKTERNGLGGTPIGNTSKTSTGAASGMKPSTVGGAEPVAAKITTAPPMVEASLAGNNAGASALGAESQVKNLTALNGEATGPRLLTPTGTRNAATLITGIKTAGGSAGRIAIAKGTKLPNYGTFAVVYNSAVVNFDVSPRILDGIPMTPFRHLFEKAGGTVDWESLSKSVRASADGQEVYIQIGDKIAKINKLPVELEMAPFLDHGRTVVPLSFIREALKVDVEYDKATGHVLITSVKK